MNKDKMRRSGFTLLEVIVSIVITAILAAMLIVLMGNPVSGSADPVLTLKNAYDIQKVMENIASKTNGLSAMKASIGAEGSSAANAYGTYEVVYNRYVTISSGTEVNGGTNVLKVTIRNAGGDRLTRLFCQ